MISFKQFIIESININSKEFKRWFDDSKVVDSNNTPLIVYHGTDKNFNEFNKDTIPKDGKSHGFIFFTSSEKQAKKFGSNIKQVYLSLKNPLIVKSNSWSGMNYYDDHGDEILNKVDFSLHDGIIIKGNTEVTYIVFSTYQIKIIK